MITPISFLKHRSPYRLSKKATINLNNAKNNDSKSFPGNKINNALCISFGYCEKSGGHYQKMYEIDTKFADKVAKKINSIDEIRNKIKSKYIIADESNKQAAKLIMQYCNMQTVFAEMPPAYTIVTGTKLKEAMEATSIYTNPIDNLITINHITKISGVNPDLQKSRQEKATRASQLYSILILLDQIKANTKRQEYIENQTDIEELVRIIEQTIKEMYGDDIFDRVDHLSKMGRKVSQEDQKLALSFLIEIDCKSKDMILPFEFEEKLNALLRKQNQSEGRTEIIPKIEKQSGNLIKIFYPDHEHTLDHLNGVPHTHNHTQEKHHKYSNLETDATTGALAQYDTNNAKKITEGE